MSLFGDSLCKHHKNGRFSTWKILIRNEVANYAQSWKKKKRFSMMNDMEERKLTCCFFIVIWLHSDDKVILCGAFTKTHYVLCERAFNGVFGSFNFPFTFERLRYENINRKKKGNPFNRRKCQCALKS